MSNFRIMLLSTAAVGLAGALATPAFAGEVEKSASFSGHVHRVVGVVDNGDTAKVLNADAGASMSRIRFTGSAKSESLTTKAYIEVRARGNDSDSHNAAAAAGNTLSMRHSYLSFSNNMGTLVIGETNPSGDLNGYFSGDFSGATWTGNDGDSVNSIDSGFIVENSGNSTGSEEGALTEVNPMGTQSAGRGGVIRYGSPDFNGFSFSTSFKGAAEATEEVSASIGYSADYDGTKVAVGYGYTNKSGNSTSVDAFHSVGGGLELASGINAHVGYFYKDGSASTDPDTKHWSGSLGYDMNVIDAGETSLSVTYTQADDALTVNDDLRSYGPNVNQNLDDYGTQVYGGISKGTYDSATANYEDLTAGWVGVRVKF